MARISFRSTTVADEPAILALLQQAHGTPVENPMLDRRHLYWKYWEPHAGWPGSRSYVLTKDERIVAHGAVVPAVCKTASARLTMLHVIDWAARADAPGSGVALMQHLGKLADAIVTSDGGPMALQLLPFMGFRNSGTTVTSYVRPVRPLLYLTRADFLSLRLAARCARNVIWTLAAPAGGDGAWRARVVGAEEAATAPIPLPVPRNGTAVFERTPAMMSYWLQCPAVGMELYAIDRGSGTEGYFMLALAPGQARIVDCWLDCEAPADWEALVHLAVQQATRHPGVAEITTSCSEPLLAGALRSCGFHARNSRPLFLRANGAVPDRLIRKQMLDDDTAYLHRGSKRFWG